VQALLDGRPAVEEEIPTLYLPVNKRIRFELNARDVIHSFWIPAFLYKMDVIPGLTNEFELVPQRTGTFKGKCAELCGEFHSEMLFNVKVVSQAEYDAHMAELKARGQTGRLETDLGRSTLPTDGPNAKNGTDD
jgi:cytochrome c oxidase subunit 2